MKTKIVVDSSSNLYALPGVDFACVPLKIVTDEQEYLDDGTLDAVGMARSLRTYKGKTSTSCPNVADWLAAYEGAEQIFVATITGTLSGSGRIQGNAPGGPCFCSGQPVRRAGAASAGRASAGSRPDRDGV